MRKIGLLSAADATGLARTLYDWFQREDPADEYRIEHVQFMSIPSTTPIQSIPGMVISEARDKHLLVIMNRQTLSVVLEKNEL